MRVLDAAQMRAADRLTIEEIGVPSIVLMENAGRQVVAAIEASCADLALSRVAVLCGRGNNGGDGFVVARAMAQRGLEVVVFLAGRVADVHGDARTNLDIVRRLGVTVEEVPDAAAWERHGPEVAVCDLVVDALVGTGLTAPLAGLLEAIVTDINGTGLPVVSIDLPSGVSADTPQVLGACIRARVTVTLAAPKIPLVLAPAADRAGELVVAEIGIPARVIDDLEGPRLELLTPAHVRSRIPVRARDAHKGDCGHVVLVAGSPGKTGAARLAGLGALRSGAGLVTVATPASSASLVASVPEYMTAALVETDVGTVAPAALEAVLALPADVLAVGPGLGVGNGPRALVRGLVERTPGPLVLDADALNVLADDPTVLGARRDRETVVTPHPGEMARLAGTTTTDVQGNRIDYARACATEHGVHVVLKGARSILATPDGAVFINPTGNPGMASGGTGDVLTGVVAAWWAQLRDPAAAMTVGVHVHGLAGDLAVERVGETALTASDLAAQLGAAVTALTSS